MPWAGTNERAIAIAPLTSLLTFPPLTVILQRSSSFSPTLIAHTTARGHLRLYIGSTSSLIPHSSFLPQSPSPLLQLPVFTVDPTSPYVSSVRLTTVFTVRSTTSYHYRPLRGLTQHTMRVCCWHRELLAISEMVRRRSEVGGSGRMLWI